MNIVYLKYIALDRINYCNNITKTSGTMGGLHEDLGRLILDSFQAPSTKPGGSNFGTDGMFGSCPFQISAETPTSLMRYYFTFLSFSRQIPEYRNSI